MGIISIVSTWIIPCFILLVLIMATWQKIPTYELFVEGGKEGVNMAFSLLPFLVGMIVSISILRSSGALEAFITLISPLLSAIGIPPEIIPLTLIRPISDRKSTRLNSSHVAIPYAVLC